MQLVIDKVILKKIGKLAIPVMLSNLLQTVIAAVDMIMVGQLGPIEIAAVGLSNTLRLFILITLLSVAGGAISMIAQAKGSRDKQRMSLVTRQSIVSGIMLSLILGVAGYILSEPLLNLMNQGGEQEAVTIGTAYLKVLFLGTPFLVLNIIVNKLMQGAGDTFTPLILTIFLVLLNIIFNYIFIFGWWFIPAYGVVGAALGTILARVILVGFGIWLFHSGKNVIQILAGTWRPNWQVIKDILAIGVPSGIQGIFRNASSIFVIGIVTATSLGTYGAAVLGIGLQVEQLIAQPIVGLNVAATAIIGQEMGKWQVESAFQKGNLLTLLGIIAMGIFIIPAYYFAPEIIAIFDPSGHPKILEGSLSYFKITLLSLVLSAFGILLTGILRGAGDTKPAMYSAIFNRNVVQLGFAWFLAFPMGLGYVGAFLGIVLGRFLDAILMSYFWLKRKWIKVALEKTDIYRMHLHHLPPDNLASFLEEVRTPLMARRGTLEIVQTDKVIYRKARLEQIYKFKEASFYKA